MTSEYNPVLQAIYKEVSRRRHILPYGETYGISVGEGNIERAESSFLNEAYRPLFEALTQQEMTGPLKRLEVWCAANKVNFWRDHGRLCMTFQTFDDYFYVPPGDVASLLGRIRLACYECVKVGALKQSPNILLVSPKVREYIGHDPLAQTQRYAVAYYGASSVTPQFEGKALVDFTGGTDGDFALAYRADPSNKSDGSTIQFYDSIPNPRRC